MSVRAFISGCAGPALSDGERAFFAETSPWGLILFARNIQSREQVLALVADFRAIVGRPDAPVLIDQEGGRVQRIRPPLGPAHPPAARYGELWTRDPAAGEEACRIGAALIGAELRGFGVTVDCLPVLDLLFPGADKVIGDRAYAADPGVVAALGRCAIEGLLSAGVLPVIKHIPGHGRAGVDSHLALPRVDAPLAALRDTDFVPFRALAPVAPVGMTAHVLYEAIDPARPATTSPRVVREIIRGEIGFAGLLLTDDLSMQALGGGLGERAAAAFAAGCDIALHCNGAMEEMRAVADAAPPLGGEAGQRADAALAALAAPRRQDDIEAMRTRHRDMLAALA